MQAALVFKFLLSDSFAATNFHRRQGHARQFYSFSNYLIVCHRELALKPQVGACI